MFDQHFLSSAARADVFGPLPGGERMMWRGRCAVAEYAFDEAASLPRWTLPEATDVLVTDHRVRYAYTSDDGRQVRSGELPWECPQHLRVQPGQVSKNRGRAATQIQLVCAGADGTYPALVFAGGDLATVGDADRLANVIRQAIARFRLDNAEKLGLSTGQARILSRLLITPEFRNHHGGEGQTVSMLGALPVQRPAPASALPAPRPPAEGGEPTAASVLPAPRPLAEGGEPTAASVLPAPRPLAEGGEPTAASVLPAPRPSAEDGESAAALFDDLTVGLDARTTPFGGTISAHVEAARAAVAKAARAEAARADAARAAAARAAAPDIAEPTEEIAQPVAEGTRSLYRPGLAADAARALTAATAEVATQQSEPALASRAADLAARVADLVARAAGPEPPQDEIDTWELHSAAVRPGESTNRQPGNSGSSEALPSRLRRQAAPQIGNGWVSDDVRLTRDEGQGSRGAGWGFNRFEELRSPRTEQRSGVQGEKGRSARGKERPSVEAGEGRAGESGRAGPRTEDASGSGEERRGEELQAFRVEDRRAFRSYDRRTTRAEEREEDRIGPGDGRPVARSEEHRPAGAGQWRMSSGDEPRTGQSSGEPPVDLPTTNLAERAESIRRTAARLASNSARARLGTRLADLDSGVATRRNHNT